MMYEMRRRRRKPECTLLQTEGIFNLPHHICMACEELAFDDTVSYTQRGRKWIEAQLNVIAVDIGIHTTVPRVTYPLL